MNISNGKTESQSPSSKLKSPSEIEEVDCIVQNYEPKEIENTWF